MKLLHRIDKMADGMLLLGAWGSGIGRHEPTHSSESPQRGLTLRSASYGLLGAATLYKLVRALAPRTKEERRLAQMSQLYNQAEGYGRRAKIYHRAAASLLRQRINALKLTGAE